MSICMNICRIGRDLSTQRQRSYLKPEQWLEPFPADHDFAPSLGNLSRTI